MKALTTAVCTQFVASYNMDTETRVCFIRPRSRYLSALGCQRLINKGCDETEGTPKPWLSVVRVEHAALGN